VVKRLFHRLAVMNGGRIVEINDAYSILSDPRDAATKSLVEKDINIELPKQFKDLIHVGELHKIYYNGETSISPLISSVSKKVDAYINILHGKIEYVNGKPIGILLIGITGEDGEVRKAKQYIKENVSRMEEIKVG
jgi:D-methionine transport system ATP-binding protein